MLPINSVIIFETSQGKIYYRIIYYYKDIIYLIDIYGNSMPVTVSETFIQSVFFARENSPFLQRFFPRHRWGIFLLT